MNAQLKTICGSFVSIDEFKRDIDKQEQDGNYIRGRINGKNLKCMNKIRKFANDIILADKTWNKQEWAQYKKDHPGTKIQPKFKQEGPAQTKPEVKPQEAKPKSKPKQEPENYVGKNKINSPEDITKEHTKELQDIASDDLGNVALKAYSDALVFKVQAGSSVNSEIKDFLKTTKLDKFYNPKDIKKHSDGMMHTYVVAIHKPKEEEKPKEEPKKKNKKLNDVVNSAVDKMDKWMPDDPNIQEKLTSDETSEKDKHEIINKEIDNYFSKYHPDDSELISNNRNEIIKGIINKI